MNPTPTHPDREDCENRDIGPVSNPIPQGSPAPAQAPLVNIANALTVLRLILVPVFIWLMLRQGGVMRLAATVVFIVAAFTDRLDGQLARSWNLVTSFGKIADLLSVAGRLWWWITLVIIVRELGITLLRLVMLRRAVMAASRGGKLKTVLQILGIVGLLTPWTMILPAGAAGAVTVLAYLIVAGALVVTVVTGVDYIVQALRIARRNAVDGGAA